MTTREPQDHSDDRRGQRGPDEDLTAFLTGEATLEDEARLSADQRARLAELRAIEADLAADAEAFRAVRDDLESAIEGEDELVDRFRARMDEPGALAGEAPEDLSAAVPGEDEVVRRVRERMDEPGALAGEAPADLSAAVPGENEVVRRTRERMDEPGALAGEAPEDLSEAVPGEDALVERFRARMDEPGALPEVAESAGANGPRSAAPRPRLLRPALAAAAVLLIGLGLARGLGVFDAARHDGDPRRVLGNDSAELAPQGETAAWGTFHWGLTLPPNGSFRLVIRDAITDAELWSEDEWTENEWRWDPARHPALPDRVSWRVTALRDGVPTGQAVEAEAWLAP